MLAGFWFKEMREKVETSNFIDCIFGEKKTGKQEGLFRCKLSYLRRSLKSGTNIFLLLKNIQMHC